ncbi:MAG TPA: ABC transporter ATP-binding protein [Candidatus Limnocylindria bacterium]|nr:ABC transporter ATP-binding protein [Candidatus Limnocylindria bacterium]
MSLLTVEGLSAAYGRVTTLWDVSFTVGEGEIVSLIGSNGAGKTTSLRVISGLLPVRGGRVTFDGRDLARLRSDQIVELGVVHVPEGRLLWPRMTVEENLVVGAYLPRAKAKRAENLARVYGQFPRLRERRNQLAGTLSGGERQMCAIARGLMAMPRLLMLDEPSLGLAPILVGEIFRTIRALHDEGITVLLVEQNVHRALEIAQRGYVLELGRVAKSGSGQELLADPHVKTAYLGL